MTRLGLFVATILALGCSGSNAGSNAPTVIPPTHDKSTDEATDEATVGAPATCAALDPEEPMKTMVDARIGALSLGMTPAAVESALGAPDVKGALEPNEVAGGRNWPWSYEAKGIELVFTGEGDKSEMPLASIVVSKAGLETNFGVKVGSSVADVKRAYGPCLSAEDSSDEVVVAGSVYGGVLFSIADGVVSRIFVGAAAE